MNKPLGLPQFACLLHYKRFFVKHNLTLILKFPCKVNLIIWFSSQLWNQAFLWQWDIFKANFGILITLRILFAQKHRNTTETLKNPRKLPQEKKKIFQNNHASIGGFITKHNSGPNLYPIIYLRVFNSVLFMGRCWKCKWSCRFPISSTCPGTKSPKRWKWGNEKQTFTFSSSILSSCSVSKDYLWSLLHPWLTMPKYLETKALTGRERL